MAEILARKGKIALIKNNRSYSIQRIKKDESTTLVLSNDKELVIDIFSIIAKKEKSTKCDINCKLYIA